MASPRTFAFVFPCASGHVNPSLAVARRLAQQGHKVHFLCREQMRDAIEDTGAVFHSDIEAQPELYEGQEPDIFGTMDALKREFGVESMILPEALFSFKVIHLERKLPGTLRWLRRIGADAVLYDPFMSIEALYAAKVIGIQSVSLITTAGPGSVPKAYRSWFSGFAATPDSVERTVTSFEPHLAAIRRLNEKHGFSIGPLDSFRPFGKLDVFAEGYANLVTTSDDLEDPMDEDLAEAYRKAGASFEAVGPLLDEQGARRAGGHKLKEADDRAADEHPSDAETLARVRGARAAGRRVVLASMGTVITGDDPKLGWHSRPVGADGAPRGLANRELCQAAWAGAFDALGAAAADEGALLVVALGPQENALGDLRAPPNALCLPMVAQVDVLNAGVDVFLTHGGQNSFTESLATGVPVVVCPGFGDQPVNAGKAVALGVGLQVPRPDPDAGQETAAAARYRADVAAALASVVAEPSFAEAAARAAGRLARLGGVTRAAEVMLQAADSGSRAVAARARWRRLAAASRAQRLGKTGDACAGSAVLAHWRRAARASVAGA